MISNWKICLIEEFKENIIKPHLEGTSKGTLVYEIQAPGLRSIGKWGSAFIGKTALLDLDFIKKLLVESESVEEFMTEAKSSLKVSMHFPAFFLFSSSERSNIYPINHRFYDFLELFIGKDCKPSNDMSDVFTFSQNLLFIKSNNSNIPYKRLLPSFSDSTIFNLVSEDPNKESYIRYRTWGMFDFLNFTKDIISRTEYSENLKSYMDEITKDDKFFEL